MSEPLTSILANAAEGSAITSTLSAESVQVIFFALGFLDDLAYWKQDYFDQVTEAEALQIYDLLAAIPTEMLP